MLSRDRFVLPKPSHRPDLAEHSYVEPAPPPLEEELASMQHVSTVAVVAFGYETRGGQLFLKHVDDEGRRAPRTIHDVFGFEHQNFGRSRS